MKRFKMKAPLMLAIVAALALSVTTATAMGASHKKHADKLTIGFVTHAVGDPFIKQILQAAKDAGKDLGVNVKTEGTPAFDPAGQLKMVQDLFASGADGVATSITGDSMATGLNALIAQGKPIVEFNIYSTRVNAPYVGERAVGDWALLGKAVRTKMGAAANGATVVIGTCAPGFPALVDRINGVKRGLGAGVKIKGPYDVTGDPVKNYSAWQQLIAANPDAKALIGVCAQDLASFGKLNKDKKYITAGGDPTISNLAALASGAGLISMGQTGYVQGYLPVKMIVDAIRSHKALPKTGFISSGFEKITATGSKEDHGLPALPMAQIRTFQTNAAAQKAFYHQLFFGKGYFVNWQAHVEPIANASR
jgi:ABC-type sugar transport system substrate-binding protein